MIIEWDPAMGKVSGKFGNVVCKTFEDKSTMSSLPVPGNKGKRSAAQKAASTKFGEASKKAKEINDDPEKRKEYEETCPEGRSVFCHILEKVLQPHPPAVGDQHPADS
jgi:hypothetical protein